jgi:hypothetical protein
LAEENIGKFEVELKKTAEQFAFFQEMRAYITDLLDCLGEKVLGRATKQLHRWTVSARSFIAWQAPQIEEYEERLNKLMIEHGTHLRELREADREDELQEVKELLGLGTRPPPADHRARACISDGWAAKATNKEKQEEVRRRREARKRRLEQLRARRAEEGRDRKPEQVWDSDEEVYEEETAEYERKKGAGFFFFFCWSCFPFAFPSLVLMESRRSGIDGGGTGSARGRVRRVCTARLDQGTLRGMEGPLPHRVQGSVSSRNER